MKNLDSVSVIIPTFNRSNYICEAIDSVLNQDASNVKIEIIVVDDGSTDDTRKILEKYIENNKIQYIFQVNSGVAAARNRGISAATGKWITFLDSDDRWRRFHLSLQISVISKFPHCNVIFSDFIIFRGSNFYEGRGLDAWDKTVNYDSNAYWKNMFPNKVDSSEIQVLHDGKKFDIYHGNIFSGLLFHPVIPCWTALISRESIKDHIRFSEKLAIYEEAWLFSLLAEDNHFCFVDVATAENRGHEGPRVSDINLLNRIRCHISLSKEIYEKSCSVNRPPKSDLSRFLRQKNIIRFKECVKNNLISEARESLKELQKDTDFSMNAKLYLFKLSINIPGNPIGIINLLKQNISRLAITNLKI